MTFVFATAGVVTGGWSYIYAAYALTWLILGGYGVSLWMRDKNGGRR